MSQAKVIFKYEGIDTTIQCNIKDRMSYIIQSFLSKSELSLIPNLNLTYLYNGTTINPYSNLTFYQQANSSSKESNQMTIIVNNNNPNELKNEIISKDIICPTCKQNCLINIQNYKISFKCNIGHEFNSIPLNYFYEKQKIDLNTIKCDLCNIYTKANTNGNEFYICSTCNKNMCILCKSNHQNDINNNNHTIINYDDKNYICRKHGESFCYFCNTCRIDLCLQCKNDHMSHNLYEFNIINKSDLQTVNNNLRKAIDSFEDKINIIKQVFVRMTEVLEKYYEINNKLCNNYNPSKRNYYILENMKYLRDYNNNLIKNELNVQMDNLGSLFYGFTNGASGVNGIYSYSFNNFYNINMRGEKYIGNIKNGLKDGKGVLFWDFYDYRKKINIRKKCYEGDFKKDKLEGSGIMIWDDGYKYNSKFINNKIVIDENNINNFQWYIQVPFKFGNPPYFNENRVSQIIVNKSNGDTYEGSFYNGQMTGMGLLYYNSGDLNGSKYEGSFVNGKKEGTGKMFYYNGDRYEGGWKNDNLEGLGKYFYNNGDRYEGNFKNGKREGEGTMFWNNSDIYIGDWKNDIFEGNGKCFYNNKNRYERYEGQIKNWKKEGKGVYFYYNGDRFEGNWKNDFADGKGVYYFQNGDRFEGEWEGNNINQAKGIYFFNDGNKYNGIFTYNIVRGRGIYNYNTGDKYEGEFINGIKEGWGTYYFRNGDIYIGHFKNNVREGNGKLLFINREVYNGIWRNDKPYKGILYDKNGKYDGYLKEWKKHGKGTYYFNDGDKYVGDFVNDMRYGKGTMIYKNGDKYEGEFENWNKDGKGIYIFNNGDKYTGNFKNDICYGYGIINYKNDNEYEKYDGEFKNDIKEGKGKYIYKDGDLYEGDWKNDIEEGQGVFHYKEGNTFKGEFKNGLPEGQGILFDDKDNVIKEGIWSNGNFVEN